MLLIDWAEKTSLPTQIHTQPDICQEWCQTSVSYWVVVYTHFHPFSGLTLLPQPWDSMIRSQMGFHLPHSLIFALVCQTCLRRWFPWRCSSPWAFTPRGRLRPLTDWWEPWGRPPISAMGKLFCRPLSSNCLFLVLFCIAEMGSCDTWLFYCLCILRVILHVYQHWSEPKNTSVEMSMPERIVLRSVL